MMNKGLILLVIYVLFFRLIVFQLNDLGPTLFSRFPIARQSYKTKVELFPNRLSSSESVLPYEYSFFDFCGATNESSLYQFDFLKNDECHLVCTKKYSAGDAAQQRMLKRLQKGMILNYQQHWIIDNMPVTLCYKNAEDQEFCSRGFPIGCYVTKQGQSNEFCNIKDEKNDTFYVFNHLDFEIIYHSGQGETWGTAFGEVGGRIIAAKVQVNSLNSRDCDRNAEPVMFQSTTKDVEIPFTYSVKFVMNNDIRWESRWDYILKSMPLTQIQWFSILISVFSILVLSIMLLSIFSHTDYRQNYFNEQMNTNKYKSIEELLFNVRSRKNQNLCEDDKWRLLHGDVFRSPQNGTFLSVLIGNGVQICATFFITFFAGHFANLLLDKREILINYAIFNYILMSIPAGYISARFYKKFGGDNWKKIGLLIAIPCPGTILAMYASSNVILWINESLSTLSLTKLLILFALWLCISTPLVLLGTFIGFKEQVLKFPVRTNDIPRGIPKQSPCTKSFIPFASGSIISFSCICIQVHLLLNNIWIQENDPLTFHLSFLVYILLIIICSESTILLCYFRLCAEEYHWWWRSFLVSGFTTFYVLLHSICHFLRRETIVDSISIFAYFSYAFSIVFLVFLITGTIGFLACFWFIRRIYSTVKTDAIDETISVDF